eukprot:GILJ01013253.1.p1 GENE.GILJ01013253.1~~GILJ01013253.1.p1  ORF type:complete len:493 (+),score=75.66 GILJ01013253.1:901-2379(+)
MSLLRSTSSAPGRCHSPACVAHLTLVSTVTPSTSIPDIVHLQASKLTIRIGRSKEMDVRLDSTRVPRMISRLHASIMVNGTGDTCSFSIVDEESINGLYVNGTKIKTAFLRHGDLIIFGREQKDSEFIYQFQESITTTRSQKRKQDGSLSSANPPSSPLTSPLASSTFAEQNAEDRTCLSPDAKRPRIATEVETSKTSKTSSSSQPVLAETDLTAKFAELERKQQELTERERRMHVAAAQLELQLRDQEVQRVAMQLKIQESEEREQRERAEKEKEREKERIETQLKMSQERQVHFEELENELMCSICHDWLVVACTLECSHTFCRECLESWMKHKRFECPSCRAIISKEPLRNRTLDQIAQKSFKKGSPEEVEYRNRIKLSDQAFANREKEKKELQAIVDKAVATGRAFMSIRDSWTADEKKLFKAGVQQYEGPTRAVYCATTGLTSDFLAGASPAELAVAGRNVGFDAETLRTLSAAKLKGRLFVFTKYG